LETEEGAALEPVQPIEYERDDLAEDIEYLATFPREPTARDLGISVRGWWKLIKSVSFPREGTAERIRAIAAEYRLREVGR
jgi:hypothetical protein